MEFSLETSKKFFKIFSNFLDRTMVDAMNSVKKLALYPCLSVLAHTLLNLLVLLPPHWEELTPLAQLLHKSQQMAASSESKEIAKILNIIQ